MVSEDKAAHNTLATGELAIQFSVGANDVYVTYNDPNNPLLIPIDVSSGQIIMSTGTFKAVHYAGGPALDTVTASVTINK